MSKGLFGASVGVVAAVAGAVAGVVLWRKAHEVPLDSPVPKDERRKVWLDPERAEIDDVFRDGEGEGFLE